MIGVVRKRLMDIKVYKQFRRDGGFSVMENHKLSFEEN